jgi:hypothetical protein
MIDRLALVHMAGWCWLNASDLSDCRPDIKKREGRDHGEKGFRGRPQTKIFKLHPACACSFAHNDLIAFCPRSRPLRQPFIIAVSGISLKCSMIVLRKRRSPPAFM